MKSIDKSLLKDWPLPELSETADKETRGAAIILAGSKELAGAAVLAGLACLRAGAGKLKVGSTAQALPLVAIQIPESRVLEVASQNEIFVEAGLAAVSEQVLACKSVLIGPGLLPGAELNKFTAALIRILKSHQTLILDASALKILKAQPSVLSTLKGRAIITPHHGEMASLIGAEKEEIDSDPEKFCSEFAKRSGAITILKGQRTFIASPEGEVLKYKGDCVGLATSGSGDVLAGTIAGLAARGATPLQASAWGVYLHGKSGKHLTKKIGRVGFLARELIDELPKLLEL